MNPRVWTDSSACPGIVRRTSSDRLRHLEIRHMWTQERLQQGEFLLKAVPTDDNVADLITKHLAAARVEELLSKLGVRRCTRGLMVASLITKVEANHFDACQPRGDGEPCTRGHVAGRGVRGSDARTGCASSCWSMLLLAWVLS